MLILLRWFDYVDLIKWFDYVDLIILYWSCWFVYVEFYYIDLIMLI